MTGSVTENPLRCLLPLDVVCSAFLVDDNPKGPQDGTTSVSDYRKLDSGFGGTLSPAKVSVATHNNVSIADAGSTYRGAVRPVFLNLILHASSPKNAGNPYVAGFFGTAAGDKLLESKTKLLRSLVFMLHDDRYRGHHFG
jgi:hypothetical protein